MRILGLIPARGGSKGVPRKNIRPLGGRPLLDWTVQTAHAVGEELDRVIVSTEDEEIAAIARQCGAEVPFLRPAELADDAARSIDVVIDVLQKLADQGEVYDALCLLQPTTPFRSKELLQAALRRFQLGGLDGLVTASRVPAHYHPNWTFIDTGNALLTPAQGPGSVISRRQDLPPAFIRDGAVYLTKTAVLLDGSFFGERLGYVENTDPRRVNIDTLQDWALAESML
ncbi:MAG: acylneuraminate cytidylyltransferase family protein [Bacteroidota bacterium]